jgi:methionyl-tRNA formyltransferase
MKQPKEIKVGFFGTPPHAVTTLEALASAGYQIAFVVTTPDRAVGRGLIMTPTPVKIWALGHGIPVFQPENLRDSAFAAELKRFGCDAFVVIAYGKIIPEEILNIPNGRSINIHGSLLPKLRGASPIETAILEDMKETGVTLIKMDSKMDHGPIVAMEKVICEPWPPTVEALRKAIVNKGNELLVSVLPGWIAGDVKEQEQDHPQATIAKKISKEDALIDLAGDPYLNFRKIQAYHEWPIAYFIFKTPAKDIRVKITSASFKDGKLLIEKVIPEGKKEMAYKDFLSGYSR